VSGEWYKLRISMSRQHFLCVVPFQCNRRVIAVTVGLTFRLKRPENRLFYHESKRQVNFGKIHGKDQVISSILIKESNHDSYGYMTL